MKDTENLKDMASSNEEADLPKLAGPSKSKGPHYPYGLSLTLNADSLKKLGIKNLPKVGSHVRIHAKAHVQSVSQSQHHGDKNGGDKRMELQIRHMGVHMGAGSVLDAVDQGIEDAND